MQYKPDVHILAFYLGFLFVEELHIIISQSQTL